MLPRGPVIGVVLGVAAAAALVGGSYQSYVAPPTILRFDGVALNITYEDDLGAVFGPAQQNACNEPLPAGSGFPVLTPDCPTRIVGGATYAFEFIVLGNPCLPEGGLCASAGLWTNLTVWSHFWFQLAPSLCGGSGTSLNRSTGIFVASLNFLFDQGQWIALPLSFSLPYHATTVPQGLWLNATLSVQPTNHTERNC